MSDTLPVTDHAVSGKTVLITGGAGFVGSHLADALVPDNEVRILDDRSTGRLANVPDGATFVEGDVRDGGVLARAMAGVDCVFHQAAMVSVPESVDRPLDCQETNAAATARLLECARRADARVVFASSAAIYGRPETVPIAEEHPTRPASPYGVAKLAADHHVRLYADLYDLPAVALRYFNVYGPRQRAGGDGGVVAVFREQARRGGPITIEGDGEQTRDFVHVADVVRANLLAATTDRVGRAFNVGTGVGTTVNELAAAVRREYDGSIDVNHVAERQGDVRHSRADVSRARAVLDFEPTISLADGLATVGD